MKRIAVISLYYNNYNYGGLLQAYALCKTIINLGYECEQISYDRDEGEINLKAYLMTKVKHPVKFLVFGNWYKNYCLGKKLLKNFELSIPHTKVVTSQNIHNLNQDFDGFICGSDQIWNPSFGWKDSHFLLFADNTKKKIAYAASIAHSQLSEEEVAYVLKMTKGFDALSLREAESITAIKKYDESFMAEVMPDPTLLLTANEWDTITGNRKINEPYIFAYFLGNNIYQRENAIKYAKTVHKKIVFIYSLLPENRNWEMQRKDYFIPKVSVNDFLSLIKYADVVLTDSFHGSVFSCVFDTPFVTFSRSKNDSRESMNSRITTLMNILGLNRNLDSIEDGKDCTFTLNEIESIKNGLEKQRSRGLRFLSQALANI